MESYRLEKDSMGDVRVPAGALWGAQTQRGVENFPISGLRLPGAFIQAMGLIKATSAEVNGELGLLDEVKARFIAMAAYDIASGADADQFPMDVFQTGSGTSTNMNANEVIATRAMRLPGWPGDQHIHPNDHVNMGQSSNDVIPSAIHVSAAMRVTAGLLPALEHLRETVARRAGELAGVVVTGRTHLMDAVPVTLGQRLGGWAFQVEQMIERLRGLLPRLGQLPLGGTAVGTGINTHGEFGGRVAARLTQRTGIGFSETPNHFAAQSALDTPVELSAQLQVAATSLMKIANDLRWMNSGPIAGLGEIALPALQPGSSIMPGKVNPVVCEAMMMVCAQVMGNHLAVSIGNERGNFELNVMMPLIAHNLLESIEMLGNACRVLADKGVAGFTVNRERAAGLLDKNPILVTALNPVIGYDKAAQIAKRAYAEGRALKEVAAEMTGMAMDELERILDPEKLTRKG